MLLGIHFPELSLHYLARGLGAPDQPLALIAGHPLRIVQCNGAAGRAGVAPGQRLATATALCEALVWHSAPEDHGAESLSELAQWAYGLSGQVILLPPDTLVLEVSSMLKLFGGWVAWREQLQQGLAALALPCRWSLAHTPLAAQVLARVDARIDQPPEQLDKAQLLARLGQSALGDLQLPGDSRARLAAMGVHTLAQLLQLPRGELGRRFGADCLLYLERLLGERADPRPHFQPPEHYRRRLVLMEEIETIAVLRFPLNRLFSELGELLRRRQLAAPELCLQLHHRHRAATLLTLRGAGAEHRAEAWMTLCQLKLERLVLYEPVTEIVLEAPMLLPLAAESGTLLPGTRPDRDAEDLLARLEARLGQRKLYSLRAVAEIRPEYASRACPAGQGGATEEIKNALRRPSWLLAEPEPVARDSVTLLEGPERIESGWWDDCPVARDYFVAQDGAGRVMWLFRSPEGWFRHGWF